MQGASRACAAFRGDSWAFVDAQTHGRCGFEAFTNARGVLYNSPLIDPGVKYPPYSEHTREGKVMEKLL
jgi:hypothetical protein